MGKRGPLLSIPKHCHPLVRWMCEELNTRRISIAEIAEKAGVGDTTLSDWRTRHQPSLETFEAVVNALGYELTIHPRQTQEAAE